MIRNKKVESIIEEIIDQYTYADQTDRPWIIGFSGGKDSTVLLTLVWIALQRIREQLPYPFQLKRQVHVVCNDTMVENGYFGVTVPPISVKWCHFEKSYNNTKKVISNSKSLSSSLIPH